MGKREHIAVAVQDVISASFSKRLNGFGYTNNTQTYSKKLWSLKKMVIHGIKTKV